MDIITDFLVLMQKLQWISVALLLGLGLATLIVGVARRNVAIVLLGLFVGAGQFVFPILGNASLESSIEQRRASVSAMPRVRLPARYPAQIVVFGDGSSGNGALSVDEIGRLMIMTDIEEVLLISSQQRLYMSRPDNSRECRAAVIEQEKLRALGLLSNDDFARLHAIESRCRPTSRAAFTLRPSRLQVRMDRGVTRDARGRNPAPRAIQIEWVDNGRKRLVHYDEMPNIPYPDSATSLLPEGYVYPCDAFDHPQIIRNILDGAAQPAIAADLMRRPRDQRLCVQSEAPALPESIEQKEQIQAAFHTRQRQLLERRNW